MRLLAALLRRAANHLDPAPAPPHTYSLDALLTYRDQSTKWNNRVTRTQP